MVTLADRKTKYLIVCCKRHIDINTLFNTKSDWIIYNRRLLTELLKPKKNENFVSCRIDKGKKKEEPIIEIFGDDTT